MSLTACVITGVSGYLAIAVLAFLAYMEKSIRKVRNGYRA